MKYLSMLSVALFLFMGPFALGVKYAASLVDERSKLELPYKVTKTIALVAMVTIALCIIYFNYHRLID